MLEFAGCLVANEGCSKADNFHTSTPPAFRALTKGSRCFSYFRHRCNADLKIGWRTWALLGVMMEFLFSKNLRQLLLHDKPRKSISSRVTRSGSSTSLSY